MEVTTLSFVILSMIDLVATLSTSNSCFDGVVMQNVVMQSVVMLSVMAPIVFSVTGEPLVSTSDLVAML
jgi:hypothetical protein